MATTTKKIIGKVPMPRGDYASGTTYYRHNIVTHLGSAFICTAETTTSAPAALGADGMTVTVNEGWAVFADGRAIYAEGARLSAVETSASANRADIDRLAGLQNAPDDRALPLLCGQPPILFGAGTPKESVVPDNWRQYDPATTGTAGRRPSGSSTSTPPPRAAGATSRRGTANGTSSG